jgi:hypothetical protein
MLNENKPSSFDRDSSGGCWRKRPGNSRRHHHSNGQAGRDGRQPGHPFRSVLPLLVETTAGCVAVAESDRLDWSGMPLTGTGLSAVKVTLDKRSDGNGLVISSAPRVSPWRVLMFGRNAADLVGSIQNGPQRLNLNSAVGRNHERHETHKNGRIQSVSWPAMDSPGG